MRRRLDIASSLLTRPQVLFLDEPTTGLDPCSRNEIWAIVRELRREGTTLLLTTQYLEEADQLADRIAVIDRGKVIAEGTGNELKDRVGGQRPVEADVGAQHVGQHDRVAVVGFAAGDGVPVPVAGDRHRVDGVDLAAGGAQAGHQQPARGLDRHRDQVLGGVAVLGEQAQQLREPGRVVADAAAGQQVPVRAGQGDVVVVFGPVDPAVNVHASSVSSMRLVFVLA